MISAYHIIIIFIISILILIYYWFKIQYLYFQNFKIPFIPPTILLGNLIDIILFKNNPTLTFANLYNHQLAKNLSFIGIFIFHKPALLIRDPELIKRIFIKDFHYFSNRGARADEHLDQLGAYNLFLIKNPEWKNLRSNITTFFSSGKLKQMFHLIQETANELDIYLCNISKTKTTSSHWNGLEFKDICARYTTDVIASVAFGIQTNSLQNPNSEFRKHGSNIVKFTWRRAIEFTAIFLLPNIVSFFKFKVFSKESSKFLRNAINSITEQRKKLNFQRNDLIDKLIELETSLKISSSSNVNNNGGGDDKLSHDILVAQAALFFTAGFETSSSATAYALYEMAKNLSVQKQIRNEIQTILVKYNGIISYDCIMEMELLTAAVYETTRLYPTLPFLDRECTPPPDDVNGYSLEPFSDFVVPKGMVVYTPIYPIHRDPQYFPNPDEFIPDRFTNENKSKITPYTYLGFGTGPHNCIGERFALLQVKLGLVNILKNHYVCPTAKTPLKLSYDKKAFILQPIDGLYLDIISDPLI